MSPPAPPLALLLLALSSAAVAAGAPGRLLFRTWPYMNPAAREGLSFRALDLGATPPTLTTLATLPPPPAGETEISLYTGGSALDAAAGLWYSSTVVGAGAGFPPGRAVLTVFDVVANKVARRVNASTYCNSLFLDEGRLLCEAAAPWFWPPGAPQSNDDAADLVESLLEIDAKSGEATFLANFSESYVLSRGAPAFDAATGLLYMHVAQGLSAGSEVWTVDARAMPPRVVARAVGGAEPLQTFAVLPGAGAPRAAVASHSALLAIAFFKTQPPANYSLALYTAAVAGASVVVTPVGGSSGGGNAYPAVSYTTAAAALSGDGTLLYAVGTSPARAPLLVSFDTRTGAVSELLDLSVVCPDDPSPCVVGDLVWSSI